MTSKSFFLRAGAVACFAIFVLISSLSFGQQLTGTLTGTTTDASGAVVANANVILTNQLNGDTRKTVSNGSGYFSITAILPGTYGVTVEAQGFKQWKHDGIVFNQGDDRNLPQIALQVGAVTETVEISAGALTVPTDNGEISTTINEHMINDFPMGNRDAGELLKIMPGMAFANGTTQGSGFSTKLVSSASGPVGNFSANGTQPSGAMSFMLDGTNLVDPGNAGSQMANINQDMVSEVKVLMADYSAEYAKGPVIFQAFSKNGGNKYHGEGYVYARNNKLNSIDSYTAGQIASKQTTLALAAPDESYYYFGGNVGGPVPGLNKGRQKLFFWGGYEYMRQHPAGQIINFNVPTAEQLTGDLSNTTINGVPGSTIVSTGKTLAQQLQNTWGAAYNPMNNNIPTGATTTNLPSSLWDPNGAIFAGLLPTKTKPNPKGESGGAFVSPSSGNGWSDYQFVTTTPQNRWEATGKVDYAIGDNTKLTGSYSRQIETDSHPIGIWWTPPWTLPYPSDVKQNLTSQLFLVNATHVFSPTTTNEAVFTYTRFNTPNVAADPTAVSRSKLGMNIPGLFGAKVDQIPNIQGPWGGAFPDIGNMNLTGGFAANKRVPAFYDNFTRVFGTHTLKFGAYWDDTKNMQPGSGWASGANGNFNLGGNFGTGNSIADFFLGRANYSQPSQDIVNTIQNHEISFYGQDSWKVNRRLTVNYGLRFDHIGQYYIGGNGMAVWNPATYTNAAVQNPGILWHSIDHSIPVSGWVSPTFYYDPRIGAAYDIFGDGKTVVRGGFARFRYTVSVNDVGGPANLASGTYSANDYNLQGYASIAGFQPPPGGGANGTTITAFQRGDNRTPYTDDWNVSVARALPWRSVFEISYVGNKSHNLLFNGGNGKISDANSNLPGAYFAADPKLTVNGQPAFVSFGKLPCGGPTGYTGCTVNGPNGVPVSNNYALNPGEDDFRRLTNYHDIYVLTHGGYANYNSMQASWKKQAGSVSFLLNYTYSKVLGIRDGNTDQGGSTGTVVDPFVVAHNYGPLAYDHTQIVNATYVWNLPKFIHGNKILGGAVNGWQLSGYTTRQSGAPLQANGTLNFNFAGGLSVPINELAGTPYQVPDNSIPLPNGLRSNSVNQATFYGTSQNGGGYAGMLPLITCDPRHHASGAYFNPNCFGTPAYGQLGTFNWPYLHAPAYFDSDLGIYKSFKITESKSLQFRIQGTNVLNHPLPQFGLAGNADHSLNLFQQTQMAIPSGAIGSDGQPICQTLGLTVTGGSCNYQVTSIGPNSSTDTTGKPKFKTGQRVLTLSMKFYF